MQLALLRRRLPRCKCECNPTKKTGARRWRRGCAFLHAAPDASPDTAPDSALDAAIDVAWRALGPRGAIVVTSSDLAWDIAQRAWRGG